VRISIKSYGGDYTVLCDDSITGAPHSGWRCMQRQSTGVHEGWKGASQLPLGRSNWAIEVSFTGQRVFADADAAEKFSRRHRADLPNGGVMRFDAGDGDLDPDWVAYAVPAAVETSQQGATVTTQYTFLCSAFTTTDPDPAT
jgi:hypothetical protein